MTRTVKASWRWLGTPAANRVISALMVLYLGALGWLYKMQSDIVACQAAYAEAAAISTAARTQAATEDRVALDTLISAITAAQAPEQTRAALGEYQRVRRASDERRRANPLPAAPSTRC